MTPLVRPLDWRGRYGSDVQCSLCTGILHCCRTRLRTDQFEIRDPFLVVRRCRPPGLRHRVQSEVRRTVSTLPVWPSLIQKPKGVKPIRSRCPWVRHSICSICMLRSVAEVMKLHCRLRVRFLWLITCENAYIRNVGSSSNHARQAMLLCSIIFSSRPSRRKHSFWKMIFAFITTGTTGPKES